MKTKVAKDCKHLRKNDGRVICMLTLVVSPKCIINNKLCGYYKKGA